MTKEKLWKLIEAYRMSGEREEHWRNRDALDIALTDMFDVQEPLYEAQAHVMQQALDALCLPCDRWNGQQTLIVNAAIGSLRNALDARGAK